jgi:hypothetical protein
LAFLHVRPIVGENARAIFDGLIAENEDRFKGRVLTMYDSAEEDFRSCKELTSTNPDLKLDEQVIQPGSPAKIAHAIFFAPEAIRFDSLMHWVAR